MIGQTLGHYKVGEQLGRGGMGEVYVADDLNLNRKVAVKFLPEAFTGDPERMARFEREAKLLASLNHPNIAAIYGLEQAEGKRFIVMELVEGETLAQRLSKGPLPIDEALGTCRQIAEGLEAAHEKGVIHRDLKPANIMITEGDKVKILDFGLAKALSDETQTVDSSHSPTLTEAMTRPGIILGTAAYMSPEQAKGKAVDKRADIWAFGCILYECLTGKRAFKGGTVTEALASVLTKDPEWEKIHAKAKPLLRRCLEKDPKKRLRDIGEAMAWIEIPPESEPVRRPWLAWGTATLAVLTTVLALTLLFIHRQPNVAEPILLSVNLPENVSLTGLGGFALSPDGRHAAFIAAGVDGVLRLWMRSFNSLEARRLVGAEVDFYSPIIWSPDSRFIAFDAGGKIKKIDIRGGGPPLPISDIASGYAMGGSWNREGAILFGSSNGGVMRVSELGGAISQVTKLNPARHEMQHIYPVFLRDGRHFLYFCKSTIPENSGVYARSLSLQEEEPKRISEISSSPIYVPSHDSGPGRLIFLREQTLMTQLFDEKKLELLGEPERLAENVLSYLDRGSFSATSDVLIYSIGMTGIPISQPTWFDRTGKVLSLEGERGPYEVLALSPDGKQAAFGLQSQSLLIQTWLRDFSRGINTQFTFGKSNTQTPVWSPDRSRFVFNSDREGVYNIYQKNVNGTSDEEQLRKSTDINFATSWSRDGRFLIYNARDSKNKYDLWLLPMEGKREPRAILNREFNEIDGRFSPNMRWIAYVSDESGNSEVYVLPFSQESSRASSGGPGKCKISKDGGTGPRWSPDGKELYYRDPNGTVMAVDVETDTEFRPGTPKPLFRVPLIGAAITWGWDVSPDGKRFLLAVPVEDSLRSSSFTVILNWTSLLKK